MAKETLKYYLFVKGALLVKDGTEKDVNEKIQEIFAPADLQAGTPVPTPEDVVVVLGRTIPTKIDTGVRVSFTKRTHKKVAPTKRAPKSQPAPAAAAPVPEASASS
jgi:hypothetical protein